MSHTKVYEHDAATILPLLHQHLSLTLPLYQRINRNQRWTHSRILTTFEKKPEGCYVVAFVDRSVRPETEVFLHLQGQGPEYCSTTCLDCQAALIALLEYIDALEVPDPVHDITEAQKSSKYGSHIANTKLLLIGALARRPACILDELGLLHPDFPGIRLPYRKFLFVRDKLPEVKEDSLPDTVHWGKLSTQAHFDLVRQRTEIPRQAATLALIPSLALFINSEVKDEDSLPIAWAFVGVEGSLSSLHVEEEHRNKGLARLVAAKLLRSEITEEDMFGHADVGLDNLASMAVCRSLGGFPGPLVHWVRVDLSKIGEAKVQA